MGLFRRTSRKVGRVAKNVAKNVIMPQDDSDKVKSSKAKDAAAQDAPQHTDAEYDALKEKYDAVMRAKWEEYYKTSCNGECETCEYYDWCPDDFEDEAAEEAEEPAAEEVAEEGAEEAESEEEPEPERELTEEERAAKEAAEAYYEAGCDGECENCEHYDWCPAEEEGEENPDDKVLFKGITQGDVKNAAKGGVELARESAMAAKELKEAMDDILGGFDLKNLTK
ncbi:hypothetical protein [uncultured Slackia sp.]|uniref:hypothetical protein n=1 Tax=uncultured Slackia sp. TaxID=665903 RepID=UPI0025DCAA92|nr:hypothetical protein [uncultured Slackia sp.]